MKMMSKAAVSVVSSVFVSAGAAQACGSVVITDFDWPIAQFDTAVTKIILEHGYECDVKTVPSTTTMAIVSMAENGEPDILTDVWENMAGELMKMRDQGKVEFVSELLRDGGQQGWWVPKYLVDEHPQLASIDGVLANPELVGGRFYSCPDGWTCRNTNANMAKSIGMEEKGIEIVVPGSSEILATSLASAYADKQPWFGYNWVPSTLLGEYPMVKVDVGPYDKDAFDCNTTPDCAAPEMSSYPRDASWTIIEISLREREPEVVEMLEKKSYSNIEISSVLAWQENNNATAEEAAVYFLTTYKDTWPAWLSADALSRVSGLLN